MIDILKDSVLDLLKLMPFLFISFLLMELLEHKLNNKNRLIKSKKYGPLVGALLGIFPQCGFSALATNLYAARVITLGTLFAVYLSTSDEMIPILVGSNADIMIIIKILLFKFLIGIFFGFIIDLIFKSKKNDTIHDLCEDDNCHCEEGILIPSLIHTAKISFFILIVNILLGLIINEEVIVNFLTGNIILTPIVASIIGLIPNCASSVIITRLYIDGLLPLGSAISGLLAGSGIGTLILFKQNKNVLENILILLGLCLIASTCGIILNLI